MSVKAYMASLDIYYLMTEHVFLPVPLRYFFICQTWHPLRLSTCFFLYQIFHSGTFANHRTVWEGGEHV